MNKSSLPMPGDKIVASTVTPPAVITPKLIANIAQTDNLTLSGNEIIKLSHITSDTSHNHIPSSLALSRLKDELGDLFNTAEYLLSKFSNPYVISDPLCDPHFIDQHWGSENVSFDNGTATIIKRTNVVDPPYAFLRILPSAFTVPGWYYVEIQISEMSAGSKIEIRNERDDLLKEITVRGTYKFRYEVERPSSSILYFNITELSDGGRIVIDHVYLHSVKHSLNRYMVFIQEEAEAGSSGYISLDQLNEALLATVNEIKIHIGDRLQDVIGLLDLHKEDTFNPHQTRYDQVGASPVGHIHTPDECDAAPKDHTHPAEDITLEGVDFSLIADHLSDTSNKHHKVTKKQVGLENIPNAISDAINHNESESVASSAAVFALNNNHIEHVNDTSNPHDVTKNQIDLDLVENYSPATLEEHEEGLLDTRYTTPKGVKHATEVWANSGVDIQKMQPKPIFQFNLNNDDEHLIPIIPNKIYKVFIDFEKWDSYMTLPTLQNVNISFLEGDGTPFIHNTTWTYTTKDTASPVKVVRQANGNYISPIPVTYGNCLGQWSLEIDTGDLSVTGFHKQRIMTSAQGDVVIDSNITPCQTFSHITPVNVGQPAISLRFSNTAMLNAIVTVYEMQPVYSQPTVVIDATPVGHMASALEMTSLQPGWSLIDGSELTIGGYSKLWDYARIANRVLSISEWEELDLKGEDIPFFGYDENSSPTTFRIPKIQDLSQPWILNIIKVKDVTIPKDTQVLFRLIMDEEGA